jgi:hypothetical protein
MSDLDQDVSVKLCVADAKELAKSVRSFALPVLRVERSNFWLRVANACEDAIGAVVPPRRTP